MALSLEPRFEIGDVALQCVHALVGDRSGADPTGAAGLAGGARQRRGPGVEFREGAVFARLAPVIGVLRRSAGLDAAEAPVDIGDKADAAHLAIGDDVDAGLRLLLDRLGHRGSDAGGKGGLIHRVALLLLQDQTPQIIGPW